MITSHSVLLSMRKVSDKNLQKTKTHFTFNNFYSEYSAFDEIMWKNLVQSDRPQMTISYYACALHVGYL
jgi:hypothetical protein